MNKGKLETNWREVKGRIQRNWSKLTNDDLDRVEGNYDILVSKIQNKYGDKTESIKKKLDNFIDSL